MKEKHSMSTKSPRLLNRTRISRSEIFRNVEESKKFIRVMRAAFPHKSGLSPSSKPVEKEPEKQ